MDPRSSAGKSILALGSVLTILGVGTWMLVAGSTLAVIAPALVGAGFLLIGGICLKVGGCHRQLLWLSVLIALLVIWSSFDAILESLRFADGVPPSPTTMLQAVSVLLCGSFVFFWIRRLTTSQVSG